MFKDFRLSYTHLGLLTGLSPYPPILHVYYMPRECVDVSGGFENYSSIQRWNFKKSLFLTISWLTGLVYTQKDHGTIMQTIFVF